MQKKDVNTLLKPIGKLFRKFHLLIFFIFIVACLSAAVITTNAILTGDDSSTSSVTPGGISSPGGIGPGGATGGNTPTTIDQATLQRIQSLKPSTEPSTYVLPQGVRSNPFAE